MQYSWNIHLEKNTNFMLIFMFITTINPFPRQIHVKLIIFMIKKKRKQKLKQSAKDEQYFYNGVSKTCTTKLII